MEPHGTRCHESVEMQVDPPCPRPTEPVFLHDNIGWMVDSEPGTACLYNLEPEDPANHAMLNSVAFDGAKTIILVPNRYDLGVGPSIHVPAGATVLEVLTAIADDYQKRPMTEDELDEETEGCGLDESWEKAWKNYIEDKDVYRVDIMGCGVFFEGFHTTDGPNVLHLSLGS